MSDAEVKTWTLKHWLWAVSIPLGVAAVSFGVKMIYNHEVALTEIKTKQVQIKEKADKIGIKVDAVHDQVTGMKEREKSTSHQLEKLDEKVDEIKKDTSSTASDVRYLKQVIERQTAQ